MFYRFHNIIIPFLSTVDIFQRQTIFVFRWSAKEETMLQIIFITIVWSICDRSWKKVWMFIKNFHLNECLWNKNSKQYKNRVRKRDANLLKKYGISTRKVEKKISNLRCQFQRKHENLKNIFLSLYSLFQEDINTNIIIRLI